MYFKIVERQLLEGIVSFLDSKNIDTTDLKERETLIINENVVNAGGDVGNIMFGNNNMANFNRTGGPTGNSSSSAGNQSSGQQ